MVSGRAQGFFGEGDCCGSDAQRGCRERDLADRIRASTPSPDRNTSDRLPPPPLRVPLEDPLELLDDEELLLDEELPELLEDELLEDELEDEELDDDELEELELLEEDELEEELEDELPDRVATLTEEHGAEILPAAS